MSRPSSSEVEWFTRLEPGAVELPPVRSGDPRLGQLIERWRGDAAALRAGRAAIVGFPQDEGVRRNHGRPGAAEAPRQIRHWLYRLTPWDGEHDLDLAARPPIDLGDVRINGGLEESQTSLGIVVGELLQRGLVPIVLGGGHETAFGHFLGYANSGRRVGIINLDAHLDVRPTEAGQGHSGSPFRQALEHEPPATAYVCLGAQPSFVSRDHADYVRSRGGVIAWAESVDGGLSDAFAREVGRLAAAGCRVYVTLDADVVQAADVPGVSAPNIAGLPGELLLKCAWLAGSHAAVSSFDLVEINPRFDQDSRSCRWGALAVWHFLLGHACRSL